VLGEAAAASGHGITAANPARHGHLHLERHPVPARHPHLRLR
jgi:hypothetical protein